MQSMRPVNSRSEPLPTSAARRVRAKSSGYTMSSDEAPAAPPDATLAPNDCQNCVFGSYLGNIALKVSLKAKLNACVGK